jgi:hypothetical protein
MRWVVAAITVAVLAFVSAGARTESSAHTQGQANPIVGTEAADVLAGTTGADALYGLGGDDQLSGAAGDDDLDGGLGSDVLAGGPGDDSVTYADATTSVNVTLDGRRNDGAAGERDHVRADVESVYGGSGSDTLTGNAAANTLDGGAGDDVITGGRGEDGLYGGAGDDVIDARDGRLDQVDCGPGGGDQYRADRIDRVVGCERVRSGNRVAIPVASYFGVPSGLSVRRACRPGIRLELRLRGRILARAKVRLRPVGRRCEFRKTFRVSRQALGDARMVRCRVRYGGSPGLGSYRNTLDINVPAPR